MKSATTGDGSQDLASSLVNVTASTRRRALVTATGNASTTPSVWEPVERDCNSVPTTSEVLASSCKPLVSPQLEHLMIGVLTRPVKPDESHKTDAEARERELSDLFAILSQVEAYALRRRLDAARADDELVVAFRRLIIERRTRLRSLLADPRRGR